MITRQRRGPVIAYTNILQPLPIRGISSVRQFSAARKTKLINSILNKNITLNQRKVLPMLQILSILFCYTLLNRQPLLYGYAAVF